MPDEVQDAAGCPAGALLFPDFTTGRAVQLHGTATLEWTSPGSPGDDGLTGRRVHFTIRQAASGHLLPVHADPAAAYALNPPLTGGPIRLGQGVRTTAPATWPPVTRASAWAASARG